MRAFIFLIGSSNFFLCQHLTDLTGKSFFCFFLVISALKWNVTDSKHLLFIKIMHVHTNFASMQARQKIFQVLFWTFLFLQKIVLDSLTYLYFGTLWKLSLSPRFLISSLSGTLRKNLERWQTNYKHGSNHKWKRCLND